MLKVVVPFPLSLAVNVTPIPEEPTGAIFVLPKR
jgi:hypothetical protein